MDEVKSRTFHVYDRRREHEQDKKIHFTGLYYSDLKQQIREEFQISTEEKFVVDDTSKDTLRSLPDLSGLQNDAILVVQNEEGEAYSTPVKQNINVQPHYNTIVKSGQYDYYASEGRDPLPYALAELIDNSLSATARNTGPRKIEVRLYLDGTISKHWMVCVLDNGKGMTAKELGDWAVLRKSKFDATREYSRTGMNSAHQPRFLNSDISFFGVGGKQACFYIGESVTVFTKAAGSPNVCEMTMSTDRFEEREKSGKQVYDEELTHRKPGKSSFSSSTSNPLMRSLIQEESGKESFTHVAITETRKERKESFKDVKRQVEQLCMELANIYQYYIHGETGIRPDSNGSTSKEEVSTTTKNHPTAVDITVASYNKQGMETKRMKLHDITQNSQSQFIKTAADTFEFQIEFIINLEGEADQPFGKEVGIVEGILRYHPFLYTNESFPGAVHEDDEEEDEEATHSGNQSKPARGNQPIFNCYWNGRLIPYTTIKDFDWCSRKKMERTIPEECYNRVSGVLFTNDVFKVSTNKLTFQDLEERLKLKPVADKRIDQEVFFTVKTGGQFKRTTKTQMEKKFKDWLQKCHNEHDKQIFFKEPAGHFTRNKRTWTRFKSISWCGQEFRQGKLVRTQDKPNVAHGRIQCFLLEGEHEAHRHSAGGFFEMKLEPEMIYGGETAEYALRFLDRTATDEDIAKSLEMEAVKLPKYLVCVWTGKHDMKTENDKQTLVSGKTMGGISAVIRNSEGTDMKMMPSHSRGRSVKWLGVKATLCRIANSKEERLCEYENMSVSNTKDAPPGYNFDPFNIKDPTLGDYIIRLEVIMKDPKLSGTSDDLPKKEIPFTIVAGLATRFCIKDIPRSIQLGMPFSITLDLLDDNGKPGVPPDNVELSITASEGQNRTLDVSRDEVTTKDYSLIINGVKLSGKLGTSAAPVQGKITIALPELMYQTRETRDINLHPGIPKEIHVPRFQTTCRHKNGGALKIDVEIKDAYGNLTYSGDKEIEISCKFTGDADLPFYQATSNADGKATLTGDKILIKNLRGRKDIAALVYCPQEDLNMPSVNANITIEPREGPCAIKVYNEHGIEIKHGDEFTCVAGQVINSLAFKLFDEAENEVAISDDLASNITLFGATASDPAVFRTGRLPAIRMDNTVEASPKSYQIRVRNTEVEFDFKVRALPGEPAKMRCSYESEQLQCGDALNLIVQILDQHGNVVDIKDCPQKEDISLKTTEEKTMLFEGVERKNSGFIIKDIEYPKVVSSTGNFKGSVQYQDFCDELTMALFPGPPHQLVCISHSSDQKENLKIHNGEKFEKPLIFRLFDEFENCISDPQHEIQIKCSKNLQVIPDQASSSPNESTGEIAFHGLILEVARDKPRKIHNLQTGKHCIRAVLKRTQIKSDWMSVEILPNPNQPHAIEVEFQKREWYEAGTVIPCVKVIVKAEDGNIMRGLPIGSLQAEITVDSTDLDLPEEANEDENAMELDTSAEMQPTDVKDGSFCFRNIPVPTAAGCYRLTFLLRVGEEEEEELRSNEELITVRPGQPVKLVPKEEIPLSHVSNNDQPEERLVMKTTSLYLVDTRGNVARTHSPGKVEIAVAGGSHDEVPDIDGKTTFNLENGHADIPDIYLKKGCPGMATRYELVFTPQLSGSEKDIEPFVLEFNFYNDVKEMEKNAEMTQRKSELQKKIDSLDNKQKKWETRRKNLKGKLDKAQNEVSTLLSSMGELTHLQTVEDVETEKSRLEERITLTEDVPCRASTIPVYSSEDLDILGKVAHLAEIQEDNDAKVISWHLEPYMEYVVTRTMTKAFQLHEFTKGEQGVLALNANISKDWEKSLPHVKLKTPKSKVPGNIVYARKVLKFTDHPEECKQVFTQLLGDTIIVDTLPDARNYREMIIPHTSCPTILTRDGHRMMDSGAFSGCKNRCPIDMKGRVFRQPEPAELHDLRTKIEKLPQVEEAFRMLKAAQNELESHTNVEKYEAIQSDMKELVNAKKELKAINEKLQQDKTKRKKRKRQGASTNKQSRAQLKRAKKSSAT